MTTQPARPELYPERPAHWLVEQPLQTTMGVGGPARFLAPVSDAGQVLHALDFAARHQLPWWVLGGGSNVVIADAGLPGVVLHPSVTGQAIAVVAQSAEHVALRVAAGLPWDTLVQHCVQRGWQGLECLSGIPGQVGAAPIQNIGAYGQEVGEVLLAVHGVDCAARQPRTWSKALCELGYRDSWFKRHDRAAVVLAVDVQLRVGAPACRAYDQVQQAVGEGATLAEVRDAVLNLRRSKGMVAGEGDPDARSCGSFFTNPVVDAQVADDLRARLGPRAAKLPAWPQPDGRVKLSAAWLIEQSGLRRGDGQGAVGLSTKHTLAIVNRGAATAAEVWRFADFVVAKVMAETGVRLEPEARQLEY